MGGALAGAARVGKGEPFAICVGTEHVWLRRDDEKLLKLTADTTETMHDDGVGLSCHEDRMLLGVTGLTYRSCDKTCRDAPFEISQNAASQAAVALADGVAGFQVAAGVMMMLHEHEMRAFAVPTDFAVRAAITDGKVIDVVWQVSAGFAIARIPASAPDRP